VKPIGHIANTAVTPKTGLFATLAAFLHRKGSGARKIRQTGPSVSAEREGITMKARKPIVAGLPGLGVLAVILALTAAPAALASGDANEAFCPTTTESSPGFRTYLPDCRAYELAVAPQKNGAVVLEGVAAPNTISEDGNHVVMSAGGAFSGADNEWYETDRNANLVAYALTREGTGWKTEPLTPPATEFSYSTLLATSASPELTPTLWGAQTTTTRLNENIYMRSASGEFRLVGPGFAPDLAGEALEQSTYELEFAGASQDLQHSVFSIEAFPSGTSEARYHGHSNLWPGDTTQPLGRSLYEYDYTGEPLPEPSLVGVKNHGHLADNAEAELVSECSTSLGSAVLTAGSIPGSTFNAVSNTGETVFFSAEQCSGGPKVDEVYARKAGAETVAISEPAKEDCEECDTSEVAQLAPAPAGRGATFEGASQDGTKVFFLTEQELLPHNPGKNLYEYDFDGAPGHRVIAVSHLASGEAAEVEGVARVAEEGSRVYFVAKGVLAGENVERRSPEPGADNLYVIETNTGTTTFVATLLNPSEEVSIGEAEVKEGQMLEARIFEGFEQKDAVVEHAQERGEITPEQAKEQLTKIEETVKQELAELTIHLGSAGPTGTLEEDRKVWAPSDERPVQSTADGQYLVFSSSARLTSQVEGKAVPHLFEYDAVSGRLVEVSPDPVGVKHEQEETFENAAKLPTPLYANRALPTAPDHQRAVSEDGSRVLFTSGAPLTAQAVPGATSVYEYRGGSVYLISDGMDASKSGETPAVQLSGIDPSGSDAFFVTSDELVPQDSEGQDTLFDAREGGGFPGPVAPGACFGEGCRGPSVPAIEQASPGSTSLSGSGNTGSPPKSGAIAKPKALTRAEKLARALKVCSAKKNRRRRALCENQAHRKYGSSTKTKSSAGGKR
jgi:hypothetical protein